MAENAGCYLRVPDARALPGAMPRTMHSPGSALAVQPWHTIKFAVVDPSGCVLRIREPL